MDTDQWKWNQPAKLKMDATTREVSTEASNWEAAVNTDNAKDRPVNGLVAVGCISSGDQ